MTALPEERFPSRRSRTGPSLCRDGAFAERPLTMREVTEDDLPELVRVDQEAFPDDPYPYFVLRQLCDLHGDCLLVLEDGKSLHGYASVRHHAGRVPELDRQPRCHPRPAGARAGPAADAGGAAPAAGRGRPRGPA